MIIELFFFKFLSYNRAVGSNKKLMRSVEMANLTSVCPIVVTPELEIIDGQNRFEVCKSKGIDTKIRSNYGFKIS